MIFGLSHEDREWLRERRKEHRHRWRLRFAFVPVQLTTGKYLWWEWYRVRVFAWFPNERHRTTRSTFKQFWGGK